MSDSTITPPLGYVPDPLQPHRVVIEFDVLARSQAEADYMVGEVLVEELAGEPDQTFAPTGLEYSGKGLETMWRASRPGLLSPAPRKYRRAR